MNRPARYNGGVSKLFRRAEQAANIGREISLQYTHAHIRYIEALAKLGMGTDAWKSLFTVNPILIQNSVPNATRRQSNMYFSSSEGDFMDRYDYAKNFDLLREGNIPVKGGWRLYSSGPGIYMAQLISNLLGIRFSGDNLIIDPVLPDILDKLEFTYTCFGKTLTFRYHLGNSNVSTIKSQDKELNFSLIDSKYKRAGIKIHKEELLSYSSIIEIYN